MSEIGEEDGVDQLRLATGELGHEGDVELVVTQGGQHLLQALIGLGVGQFLGLEPGTKIGDGAE